MNEKTSTAERIAERLLDAEVQQETRIQAQRHADLPKWLARRSYRRAVASVPPTALLTCGLLTATRPDDAVGTGLLGATAVLGITSLLLLRQASRLLDEVPDRFLDEREIGERNAAHRRAHALTLALFILITLIAIIDSIMIGNSGTPLIPGDNWIQVLMTATLVAGMIPAAVIAWRWTDLADEADRI
ncbi:hypothetical protein [Actinoplanes xinjiangensis]|uniref:hypothetical protein n=1 Tax=Actinoplanes xinjiangensis TaxID=512350 RepID=UPI0034233345